MKRIIYIYGLLDEYNKVRYIGKTAFLKKRISTHISQSRYSNKTYKNNWIKSMLNKGLVPRYTILSVTDSEDFSITLERKFIEHYKQFTKLTNSTSGGEGRFLTEEALEKRRNNKKEYKVSNETKEKLKKTWSNPELRKSASMSRLGNLNPKRKNMKIVLQYDLQNNFIKEWNSGEDAAILLNIHSSNINRCCNNKPKYKSAGGYIWKFKKDTEVKNVL